MLQHIFIALSPETQPIQVKNEDAVVLQYSSDPSQQLVQNDKFTSTTHRVLNQSGQNRYSIPMLYNPEFDTVAECLPTCYDESNPPRYEPIHYGAYMTGICSRIFSRD